MSSSQTGLEKEDTDFGNVSKDTARTFADRFNTVRAAAIEAPKPLPDDGPPASSNTGDYEANQG